MTRTIQNTIGSANPYSGKRGTQLLLLLFFLISFTCLSHAVVIQLPDDCNMGGPTPPGSGMGCGGGGGGGGGGGMGGGRLLPTPPAYPLQAPDRLLVKFQSGITDAEKYDVLNSVGVISSEPLVKSTEMPGSVLHDWLVAKVLSANQAAIKAALESHALVKVVEYDHSIVAQATPNDPRFPSLWNFNDIFYDADIDAPEAWDVKTESDVTIALLDSGIDYIHPDLSQSTWTNYGEIYANGVDDDGNGYVDDIYGVNFINNSNDVMDDFGHGSHLAGIIGAQGNNAYGSVGINWRASIMPLKVLNSRGLGYTSHAVKAMAYAANNGAKIVNASWSTDKYNQAMADAIATLNGQGILFVAAAGNYRIDNDTAPHYPASYEFDNIITVGASGRLDYRPWFTSVGAKSVDLVAPGDQINSTVPTNPISPQQPNIMPPYCALCAFGGFKTASGTSMSAAHVSGAAALLWAIDPKLTVAEMKYQILNNVDPVNYFADKTVSGGRLNLANAIPTEPGPDLVVTSMELTDKEFYTGESFQLQVTYKNRGEVRPSVRETVVKVYISRDRNITEDDSFVGNYRIFSSGLNPGQVTTRTIRAKVSARLEDIAADDRWHTYYIGAIIDPEPYDSVEETHENNNTLLYHEFVRVKKDIDLTMQSASSSVTTIPLNKTFNVSGTIANIGNSWLSSNWTWTNLGAYLSVDETWSDDDVRVGGGTVRHFFIEPGESYNATFIAWPFARDIDPGTYYLILRADDLNWEDETDETNNTIAGPQITLTAP